jgi:hypothetical protein
MHLPPAARLALAVGFLSTLAAAPHRPSLTSHPAPSLPAGGLSYGTTTSGAISAIGEIDTYTFVAEGGDSLLISLSRVSGDLWPGIRLYDPNGTLLQEDEDPVHLEITRLIPTIYPTFLPMSLNAAASGRAAQHRPASGQAVPAGLSFLAATSGTYTIHISDGFNGTLTGSYSLFLQKLNPPAGAVPIAYSQTLPGSINAPAEMDAFTFAAAAGDTVLVSLSRASGDLWQQVRLLDPTGALLNQASAPGHTELTYGISVSGAYTLLLADGFNGTMTGSYSLFLQKLDPPVNATPIAYSELLPGAINAPAEMDAFTFAATAGDHLILGLSRVAGDLWQEIRLYDPTGALLGEASAPTHAELLHTALTTGAYTVLIPDGFDGTKTGSYNLVLQRTASPVNATALTYGQTAPGAINAPAEMDAFTFTATAGDQVQITMTRVAGSFWQEIRLYDPNGALLQEHSGATQAQITRNLTATGTYTLLVADGFDGTMTGSYNLGLLQLP